MNPNERTDFDRQLKEKFDGFRPKVPAGLWHKIATQLDTEGVDRAVAMAPKRGRFAMRWLSVAALLLMGIGVAYWYDRPVAVTYLQGAAGAATQAPAQPVQAEKPDEAPIPDPVPLDVERLKRLFAKKDHKERDAAKTAPSRVVESAVETNATNLRVAENNTQPAVRDREVAMPTSTPHPPVDVSPQPEEALARVPDIEPLIPDEEEESLLASTHGEKPAFGISTILNYVVGTVDQRDEKVVTFSNDGEGSLKLDFNFGLAKNKKKKLK